MSNISMVPTPNISLEVICHYYLQLFGHQIQENSVSRKPHFFHGCKVVAVLYAEIFRLGQTQSGEQTNWHAHLQCTL